MDTYIIFISKKRGGYRDVLLYLTNSSCNYVSRLLVEQPINELVLLLTIQHYKGCSNIDSIGNYDWFFTSLCEHTLRPYFPGSLNYGMFAFLKIKLLLVEIAYRGSPQGSLNKFT